MNTPYISHITIKNFRNFLDVNLTLSHKQVIIGENNSGKTNFLRALQLILDPSFSDNDRILQPSDFHDSIEDPMKNDAVIIISIEIQGYERHNQLVAKFRDGVVNDDPATLRITYKFFPVKDAEKRTIRYEYKIFLGDNEDNSFNSTHRSLLNIKVIKALRDVEREMKSMKRSPVYQLVQQFDIEEQELEEIANELSDASSAIMDLDEIIEIKNLVQDKFKTLSGNQPDCDVELSTFDIDPSRLLYTLQVLMGIKKRPVSEISLGLCNILYITLMLLLIRDRTVPKIMKSAQWEYLIDLDEDNVLLDFYEENDKGNYILKEDALEDVNYEELYGFLNKNIFPSQSFTILAVEEPEAHLHPVLQRLIYREVLHKSNTSVIFTTHSTHLTSVAPINSIVHVRTDANRVSKVFSAAQLELTVGERKDLERYLDARRGEVYFGLGVILVEGISEEFLLPVMAEKLDVSLDANRIIICNINSTNFKPYVQLLQALGIPWAIITDGDYYTVDDGDRTYHVLENEDKDSGFLGMENIEKLLKDLKILDDEDTEGKDMSELDELYSENGCHVGFYTFEVDIMKAQKDNGKRIFKLVFSQIRPGGVGQQKNFDRELDANEYWNVLSKIEMKGIGKGRFAQRLASLLIKEQVPEHVKNAIKQMVSKVNQEDEQ